MATKKKKTAAKKPAKKTTKRSPKRKTSTAKPKQRKKLPKGIVIAIMAILGLFLLMGAMGQAGAFGDFIYDKVLQDLFGVSAIVVPIYFLYSAYKRSRQEEGLHPRYHIMWIIMSLGIASIIHMIWGNEENTIGGGFGALIGNMIEKAFDVYFGTVLMLAISVSLGIMIFDPEMNIIIRMKNWLFGLFGSRTASPKQKPLPEPDIHIDEPEPDPEPTVFKAKDLNISGIKPKKKKERPTKETLDEIIMDNTAGTFASSYVTPPLSLLGKSSGKPSTGDIKANANLIQHTLSNFGIAVEMDEISVGPTVTRYAMKPAQGVRLSRIASLQNELALALAAKSIRIEAPIPGRSLVGIEVPNTTKSTVGLGSMLAEPEYNKPGKPLLVSLGKGVSGKSHFANIGKMPHALIAGATGAGKSVTIHNIVMSLLYKNGPDMLRFIMVDPKRVEMTLYKKIPHLLTPVITDPKKAVLALKWAVKEMERRYDVLQSQTVRDIDSYHNTIVSPAYEGLSAEEIADSTGLPEKMPYIVVIIDELSDIMSSYPRELEASIVRLAQMSRAVGIHLLLATQRPSVNVITGLIKANVPTRLAMKVASQIDSRTILDTRGAEKLLGYGDMLYKGEGSNEPIRVQCPYVSEEEVKKVVEFIKKNHQFDLPDEISIPDESIGEGGPGSVTLEDGENEDPLYEDARMTVIQAKKASTSFLQRKLGIGYSRAARIVDMLEDKGVIGPANGSKPREVYELMDDPIATEIAEEASDDGYEEDHEDEEYEQHE